MCLSDFVAPLDTGIKDYIGCFAVSVFGAETMAEQYVLRLAKNQYQLKF